VDRKDLKCMGELMYQSHKGLQNNYEVSCEELDFLVDFTRNKPYVLGSRMMGGGFGGCTINLVQSQQQEHFIKAISGAYYKRFQTPCTIINVRLSDGTKRIK
jgi:galactokinase